MSRQRDLTIRKAPAPLRAKPKTRAARAGRRAKTGRDSVEQRYEHLVNSIDAIVWEADAATFNFLYVSPQAERILGYPVSRWMDDPAFWREHIHPDDRDWALEFCINATREMRMHDFQYRMIAADGRIVWLHDVVTVVVEGGRPVSLRGAMFDITERKEIREAIEVSERELRATFELSSYAQAHADPATGNVIRVNRKFSELLGYTEQELLTLGIGDLTHPDDRARQRAEILRLLSGEAREIHLRKRMTRKDGAEIVMDQGVTLLRDAAGTPVRLIAIGTDVTAEFRAVEALMHARAQAEAASKAKSEFLANMSHELRTPLNAIIGFAEFVESAPLGPLGHPRYAEYLNDIRLSGKHLLEIINDVLDMARIESGKFVFDERELGLDGVADQALAMMREQCERAGLALVRAIDPTLPRVRADGRALRQILLNLLSNAVKFTERGGTVTLAAKPVRGSGPEGHGIVLSVSDTGIGIAAEDLGRLMQPFAQVHDVYKRKYQGAGLGLTLVRSFAELHGGSVKIESAPERGTTVTVTLPESRVVR